MSQIISKSVPTFPISVSVDSKNGKINLPIIIVNITNVCNFNCSGCYTFSNFNFTGHQKWSEYAEIYATWARKIDAPLWEILGGEPTNNPDFLNWVEGVSKLWPNSAGRIATNGSNFKIFNQKFYDILCKIKSGAMIRIELHNASRRKSVLDMIKKWLKGPLEITTCIDSDMGFPFQLNYSMPIWVDSYKKIKADSWPECNSVEDWELLPQHIKDECINDFNLDPPKKYLDSESGILVVDKNNITVFIVNGDNFTEGPLIPSSDKTTFKLHDSDPLVAHERCSSKGCHTLIRGKYYKCHQVGHFAEFDQQFNIIFDDEKDRELLYTYEPITVDYSNEEMLSAFENFKNPLEQCKFCSESGNVIKLQAESKKIVFKKKVK